MKLDHTIIPCLDNKISAEFYTDVLHLRRGEPHFSFEVIHVDDTLRLLFSKRQNVRSNHYAFRANPMEYDIVLSRVITRSLAYGDSPTDRHNELEYHRGGEKGFYFDDLDGHILEVMTEQV